MTDETPRDLDPRYNPLLPVGGNAYIIPKSEVQAACEEIAGKMLISKLIAGEKSYEAEYGHEAVPSFGGCEIVIAYAAAEDGGPELLIDGKTLNQIDGETARAIIGANSALQSAIKRADDTRKYLSMENPFVKLD